jgi:hypothetical protein
MSSEEGGQREVSGSRQKSGRKGRISVAGGRWSVCRWSVVGRVVKVGGSEVGGRRSVARSRGRKSEVGSRGRRPEVEGGGRQSIVVNGRKFSCMCDLQIFKILPPEGRRFSNVRFQNLQPGSESLEESASLISGRGKQSRKHCYGPNDAVAKSNTTRWQAVLRPSKVLHLAK